MRYLELTELFDSRVEYTWEESSSSKWVGDFGVNGYLYRIDICRDHDYTFGEGWDFSFAMELGSGRGVSSVVRDGSSIMSTGSAPRVFACVLRAMGDFIDRVDPEYLAFSAQEGSRRSLYRRMVSSLLTKYSKYRRVGDKSDDSLFIVSRVPGHFEITDNGII